MRKTLTTSSVPRTRSKDMKVRLGRDKSDDKVIRNVTGDVRARKVTIHDSAKETDEISTIKCVVVFWTK